MSRWVSAAYTAPGLPPILLRAATVEWLAKLPGEAAADDFDRCYAFEHRLNAERRLTKEHVFTSGHREHFMWWLEILDHAGERILEGPLSREVLRSEVLHGRPGAEGPTVYNHLFKLKEYARRQGLGTLLYNAEGELYRRWGLSEIHMTAMDDGLEVWVKKLGFLPVNAGALAAEYPGWARARAHPLEPPLNAVDYPSEFLRSRNQLDLYKVLA